MVTYIESDSNSDLSPSWANTTYFDLEMFDDGGETGGIFTGSIPASSLRSASFITVAGNPNNDNWEDGGTQTAELNISKGSMNLRGRCRIVRLSSTGTILQSGSFTGFQTLDTGAQLTFSPVAPTFTAGACGDRIAIEFEFENTDSMMAQDLDINLGNTTTEVITDISKNSGGCAPSGNDGEFEEVVH